MGRTRVREVSVGIRPDWSARSASAAQRIKALGVSSVVSPKSSGHELHDRPYRRTKHLRAYESGALREDHRRFDDRGARWLAGRSVDDRGGMRLDDRPSAFAVDNRHHDRVRLGAMKRRLHWDLEAAGDGIGHIEFEMLVVIGCDRECSEGIGVEVHAVPGIEPVGDDVSRFAHSLANNHRVDSAIGPGRQDWPIRGVGGARVELDPNQDAVVMKPMALPSAMTARAEGQSMPWTNDSAMGDLPLRKVGAEMGARSWRDRSGAVFVAPEDQLMTVDNASNWRTTHNPPGGVDHQPTARWLGPGRGERPSDCCGVGLAPVGKR